MEIDPKTIRMYMDEAKKKIEILEYDIQTYEIRIHAAHKEIATMHMLIGKYKEALEEFENGQADQ